MQNINIEITADHITSTALYTALSAENMAQICNFIPCDHTEKSLTLITDDNSKKTYIMPIRIGTVIDDIKHHIHHIEKLKKHILVRGNIILDIIHTTIQINAGAAIQLTEKETEILKTLITANGHTIEKETLLKQIWNYADNVETHTLETHIYRLRRKIETDPANPKIVQTTDSGYKIGDCKNGK